MMETPLPFRHIIAPTEIGSTMQSVQEDQIADKSVQTLVDQNADLEVIVHPHHQPIEPALIFIHGIMAGDEASSLPKPGDLSFMQSLSPSVTYFDPKSGSNKPTSDELGPEIIILFAWMDARDAHIAKYVERYRSLYPTASILIIRCSMMHYFFTPIRVQSLHPALPVLQKAIEPSPTGKNRKPVVLSHIFSNGGVNTAATLRKLLEAEVGLDSVPLQVTIMDSCPGYGRWMSSHHAMGLSFPPWMSPFVHLIVGLFWLFYVPTGFGFPQDNNAAALNTTSHVSRETSRTYIYSVEDRAVLWRDVEAHAQEAKDKGLKVETELFEGSGHVAHMRIDPERYWKIITQVWEQARGN